MSIVELFGLKFEEGFITVVKNLKGCCLATLHSEGRAVERNRGSFHLFWVSRSDLNAMTAPDNVLAIGSPQQLVEKILLQHELFGHSRFMGQFDLGGQPLSKVARAIELLPTEVAPVVPRELRKNK